MPFPLSYRGKIEAWIGADGLDRTNYKNMFVGNLADQLKGLGRADVYVLENKESNAKGAPQFFFPHGNVVKFGSTTTGRYAKFGDTTLSQLVKGVVEVELRDEILIISYHLRYKESLMLSTALLLGLIGSLRLFLGMPFTLWVYYAIFFAFFLFFITSAYVSDLLVFRRLLKKVVKSVRDDIALNNSMSTSNS